MLDIDKDLHYREVIKNVNDECEKLSVLSKKFGVFNWPPRLTFDGRTWYFETQDALSLEEAGNYGGKAVYTLNQYIVEEAKTTNVLELSTAKKVEVTSPHPAYPQHFLIGATWDGDDKLPQFLLRGYWKNGYGKKDKYSRDVVAKMRIGDRLAVKRLKGQGATEMDILAIGVIKDVDADGVTVYVKWLVQLTNRQVDVAGCMKTAHGPYSVYDRGVGEWLRKIFFI